MQRQTCWIAAKDELAEVLCSLARGWLSPSLTTRASQGGVQERGWFRLAEIWPEWLRWRLGYPHPTMECLGSSLGSNSSLQLAASAQPGRQQVAI